MTPGTTEREGDDLLTAERAADPGGGDGGLLLRYRVLALTTATLLIVLVFVGVPLQVAAHRPGVVNVVGTAHGFLYIAYLLVAFQLTRRLAVPKWQMVLVLLAGTVPFCAFVAERSLSRRFRERYGPSRATTTGPHLVTGGRPAAGLRRRWLSGRSLLLHLAVAVVAPGCVIAGWWQATRALAGNGLSWVYSVEWPVFALLAVAGWWHLIHEDPEALKARKERRSVGDAGAGDAGLSPATTRASTVEVADARLATVLAGLVGVELVLGVGALVGAPFGGPTSWRAVHHDPVYVVHAALGLPLVAGASVLLARTRRSSRMARLTGWIGTGGVAVAAAGGLMTAVHPLRFVGVAVMLLGTLTAGFGFLFPSLERLEA